MKFAVLIITYSSALQTKRMIQALNNGKFDFYIHLDRKVDIATHQDLFAIPNVYFIEDRIDIKWAGFTTVEAALSGLRQIAASGRKYGFINLITGQDYPIKSADQIAEFFEKNVGKEFIHYKDFDTEWEEAKARVDRYHLTDFRFRGKTRLENMINRLMPKRKFPDDLKLCGKETFWTLSPECAFYVLNYIDKHPRMKKFLRYTWGSDEFIFQTIIMNSEFKDRVVNRNYRYIDWPPGSARPKVLLTEDFEKLRASDNLFARKLDVSADQHIFELLDNLNGTNQ